MRISKIAFSKKFMPCANFPQCEITNGGTLVYDNTKLMISQHLNKNGKNYL